MYFIAGENTTQAALTTLSALTFETTAEETATSVAVPPDPLTTTPMTRVTGPPSAKAHQETLLRTQAQPTNEVLRLQVTLADDNASIPPTQSTLQGIYYHS